MSGFNLAIKILQIKTQTKEDLLAYVVFPFNEENATQYEIAANNKRFAELGFGKKYHCFYPTVVTKSGSTLLFKPWLELTKDQWIVLDLDDCVGAIPIEAEYENQFAKYLADQQIDVDATITKYMAELDIFPQEQAPKVVVKTYGVPLPPGKNYVLDDTIPDKRTLH